jgi:hypothetical protein
MLLAIGKDNAINVNTRLFKYAANLIEIKGARVSLVTNIT